MVDLRKKENGVETDVCLLEWTKMKVALLLVLTLITSHPYYSVAQNVDSLQPVQQLNTIQENTNGSLGCQFSPPGAAFNFVRWLYRAFNDTGASQTVYQYSSTSGGPVGDRLDGRAYHIHDRQNGFLYLFIQNSSRTHDHGEFTCYYSGSQVLQANMQLNVTTDAYKRNQGNVTLEPLKIPYKGTFIARAWHECNDPYVYFLWTITFADGTVDKKTITSPVDSPKCVLMRYSTSTFEMANAVQNFTLNLTKLHESYENGTYEVIIWPQPIVLPPGPCDSNPCKNGGTCQIMMGDYVCMCPAEYTGTHCDIGTCFSTSCQNGGTCEDSSSGPVCHCPGAYIGSHCQSELVVQTNDVGVKVGASVGAILGAGVLAGIIFVICRMCCKVTYIVSMTTEDVSGEWTDEPVYLKFFGKKDSTGKLVLKDSSDSKAQFFKKGKTDVFEKKAANVKKIQTVLIGNDSLSWNWHLDKVHINVPSWDETYILKCDCWLGKASNGQGGKNDIKPHIKIPVCTYILDVKQILESRDACNDAEVYIQLFGETQDTGKLQLKSFSKTRASSEQAKGLLLADTNVVINAVDIGELKKMKVNHNKPDARWNLNIHLKVVSGSKQVKEYKFRWQDEGDAEIPQNSIEIMAEPIAVLDQSKSVGMKWQDKEAVMVHPVNKN